MADNEKKVNVDEVVDNIKNLNNTHDHTSDYDTQDINDGKVMSILAYIGILVLIPLFAAKDSKFTRFHTNQGLLLWIVSLVWSVIFKVLSTILGIIPLVGIIVSIIGSLVSLVFLVLMIIGIVNVCQGRAKELPVIGKYRILK